MPRTKHRRQHNAFMVSGTETGPPHKSSSVVSVAWLSRDSSCYAPGVVPVSISPLSCDDLQKMVSVTVTPRTPHLHGFLFGLSLRGQYRIKGLGFESLGIAAAGFEVWGLWFHASGRGPIRRTPAINPSRSPKPAFHLWASLQTTLLASNPNPEPQTPGPNPKP